jgi:hypothetical protein
MLSLTAALGGFAGAWCVFQRIGPGDRRWRESARGKARNRREESTRIQR